MEKFNTDTNSFEKIWLNRDVFAMDDRSIGWDWGEFQKIVGEEVGRAEKAGYKSIKVHLSVYGDPGEEQGTLEIKGWREETDEQWRSRLTWRRDAILRNIEAHEKRDIEKSRALVEKINGLIK